MNIKHEKLELTPVKLGIISDTHGHLPAVIHQIFRGVDAILHAGDIGDAGILDELRLIAPVVAVRGNMDWGDWARKLPGAELLGIGNLKIGIVHDPYQLPAEFNAGNCQVIINGHTHKAMIEEKKQILYINPGSAGQPRSNRPASVAILRIGDSRLNAEIIPLEQAPK